MEPKVALPQLKYDYTPKGNFDNIDGLPIYVSDIYMPEERKDIGRCVVWAYDIFGWVSPGRGFEMVDLLNRQTGMITVFPDFFRGEQYNETYQWDTQLQFDWFDRVKPYLLGRNCTSVGSVGTCWGSYFVTHVSADDPMVKAGFSAHPSHPGLMETYGESEADIYQSIQDNGNVQYFGNTFDMGSSTRPGGLADSILDPVYIREFNVPCIHGFYNRGNLNIPGIQECVETAYEEMMMLFDTYV